MNTPRKWLRSFRYAYEGLQYALATQHNMKFHFLATFAVLLLALVLQLGVFEILFILLSITLVIVTELFNTAVEKAVDLAMPEVHPIAKIAKDVAAAAVLVAAIFAAATGMIIFYHPLLKLFTELKIHNEPMTMEMIWIFIALVVLSVVVVQTRLMDRRTYARPSLLAAVACCMATLISMYVMKLPVIILAFALAGLTILVLYEKTERPVRSLAIGAILGILITLLCFILVDYF